MNRDGNPLRRKFIADGDNPTTYITPDRRKDIYDFMRLKVNIAPLTHQPQSKA
jgi:hypothetical protein